MTFSSLRRRIALIPLLAFLVGTATAHPLGNFTVNQFARITAGGGRIAVRFVVDMAEVPTFQELQRGGIALDAVPSQAWLDEYGRRVAADYAAGLRLTVDGVAVPLRVERGGATLPGGTGGLPTLRVECDLVGDFAGGASHRFSFENNNLPERQGWREIVVTGADGATVYDSTAFGSGVTDELKAYPEDQLTAPLDERRAEFSVATGIVPVDGKPLRTRDGKPVLPKRDRFAELIAVREITPLAALLGLLIAATLGALHALSPGHGKTVVAAYLVGTRGTAKHALFLGLTVTVTHVAGVVTLGLVTLFASRYVLPEKLFPLLSLGSGVLVVLVGGSLLLARLKTLVLGGPDDHHHHDGGQWSVGGGQSGGSALTHTHDGHTHDGGQWSVGGSQSGGSAFTHTHDGHTHTHLPPGADGEKVTWRSLLALGVSGGLLPCPSALVVLLSAIALHRVGYGLVLVLAFSVGLAGTLTAIGLAFVSAKRLLSAGRLIPAGLGKAAVRVFPVVGAFVITVVGLVICLQTLSAPPFTSGPVVEAVASPAPAGEAAEGPALVGLGALSVLGLGVVFGLKHATEPDHVVAVSTIVSEHRSLGRAALVGLTWALGHTVSIVVVGIAVLLLRIGIPENIAQWLEFAVSVMIISLAANALWRAIFGRADMHVHLHDGHSHLHVHDPSRMDDPLHFHLTNAKSTGTSVGIKPLLVGMMHGLAGSAALTLLVLEQIPSALLGLAYLAVFGLGSVGGMLVMSGLVGLPFALSSGRLAGFHRGLRIAAGAFGIAFGLWYAYETGIASGLFSHLL